MILENGNNYTAYSIIGVYGAASMRVAPLLNNMLNSYSVLWNNKPTLNELADYFKIEEYIQNDQKEKNILKSKNELFEADDISIQGIKIK